jgi:peptide/nickel transport system ATP-binding protein
VAERMAVMYLGHIVEEGQTREVFKKPRHRYTTALLSANLKPDPDSAANIIEAEGETPSLLRRPSGCEFHPRCAYRLPICSQATPIEAFSSPGHRFTCHNPP